MDLEIYDDTKNVPEEKIKLIEDVLNFAGSYLKLPENTEMSVTLMDNEHIHEIRSNRDFRMQWAEDHISGKAVAKYMIDCLEKSMN